MVYRMTYQRMTEDIGNLAYVEISKVALIRYRQTPYNGSNHLEVRMSFAPFLIIEQNCDTALRRVNQQLTGAGFRTVQTFNLNEARAGSRPCLCPHHGTEQCDCQMVVLLVYGSTNDPETLILHGSDGKTWLSFAHTMGPVSSLAVQVQKTLDFTEQAS